MATIEERAKAQLFGFDGVFDSEDFVRRIVYVATEQDRIARVEEREKCIRIAQEHFCVNCGEDCRLASYCEDMEYLRKAMEE